MHAYNQTSKSYYETFIQNQKMLFGKWILPELKTPYTFKITKRMGIRNK